jgi:hypothetical protein
VLEGVATSFTADVLVWLVVGIASTTLALVASTFRKVRTMDRLLLGEDSVDSDNGLVGRVREHDERLERLEDRSARTAGGQSRKNDD